MRQGSTAQGSMARRRWADLTGSQKALVVALGSVQLSLAAAAWVDLAARPRTRVNGRKAVWAAVIAVNWIGPLAYFRWGRR
ncbi:MAG: PLDc N-terminal domain-containing protein [Geodermatophilales bacterium]|nr:PLDc N-terminal domain-containing protein [Geodermatophilales bacterium]